MSTTEVMLAAVEQLNQRSTAGLRRYLSPDIVETFPTGPCHGPDEVCAYFQEVFDALPDFHIEPLAHAAEGDAVFLRWHITGTHGGAPFQGIAPTGKRLAIDGMDHFTIRDGLVVSNVVVFDQMAFARQLGLMPPDGGAADKALKGAFNGVVAVRRWAAAKRGQG